MNNYLEYKGYIAPVEYDGEGDVFIASVVNMEKQAVHVSGASTKELKKNLSAAIDSHIAMCKEWGVAVDAPFSGRITFRTTPKRHAELAKLASISGKRSINAFIDAALADYSARILETRI